MNLVIAAAQSASVAGDVRWNVAHHLRFAALAAEHGAQLLVFPELSLTGYELAIARWNTVCPDNPALDTLRQFATQAKMTVVAGAPLLNGKDELYIGALAFRPDGSVSTYTKVHVHESELHVFRPGPGGAPLLIGEATVALAICADASHPQHAARAAERGANVYATGALVDVAGYARKAALMGTYAREHKMAVLLANYSGASGGLVSAGRSALWSDDGQLVAACTGTEEALLVGRKQAGTWSGSELCLLPA